MIKPMMPENVDDVVSIHLESFPGFFLSFLGRRFLTLYYSGICSAEEGLGFVFLNSDYELIGFVAGTTNPRGFYTRLLKRYWLRFSLASVGAILRKPSSARRIGRALYHSEQNPVGSEVAGLFSIGVHPELQDVGAGKELVTAFLEESKAKGCTRVFLTTDRDNNKIVNDFYQNIGFIIKSQFQ